MKYELEIISLTNVYRRYFPSLFSNLALIPYYTEAGEGFLKKRALCFVTMQLSESLNHVACGFLLVPYISNLIRHTN